MEYRINAYSFLDFYAMTPLARALFLAAYGLHLQVSSADHDEQRLLSDVRRQLGDIDPYLRPLKNSSNQLAMHTILELKNLLNLDERSQTITIKIFMINFWKNEYVAWNSSEYGGRTMLFFPRSEMWTPELDTFTRVSNLNEGDIRYSDIWLRNDGTCFLLNHQVLTLFCNLNMRRYPFDEQTCTFSMISWIYRVEEMKLSVSAVLDVQDNSEFEINKFQGSLDSISSEGLGSLPIINVTLAITRYYQFVMYMVFFPMAFLTGMSEAAFLLPPNSESKAEIQLSVMLSFAVYSLLISDQMPPSTDIPIAGSLMITIMGLNLFSLLISILTINISMNNSHPPPKWIYTVSKKLGCILCCSGERPCKSDKIEASVDSVEVVEYLPQKQCSRELQYISNFIETYVQQESISDQWILIAKVLDRMYLCILTVCTIVLFTKFMIPEQ